jgi:hypothetical protein
MHTQADRETIDAMTPPVNTVRRRTRSHARAAPPRVRGPRHTPNASPFAVQERWDPGPGTSRCGRETELAHKG